MSTLTQTGTTLGNYLLDSLQQEGITEIFGVPGDYNFTLLDTLEKYEGIGFVPARNELNAGYAADGYARIKGISAMITTFGVGEMSACNAIAGAYSENVPIIHIVGTPKTQAQQGKKLMHHTLLDGDYDVFRRVYEPITAYTTVLTPENAMFEIPQAIHIAKTTGKPVYLMVAIDLVTQQVLQHTAEQPPLQTSESSLQAAINHARQLLEASENAVLLSDSTVLRQRWQEPARKLAEALNIPAASTMMGKSGFDESHARYIGMYSGAFGNQEVTETIENADTVIALGLIWSDTNTANFTAQLDMNKVINIQPQSVMIGEAAYQNIRGEDMISALIELGWMSMSSVPKTSFPYTEQQGQLEEPLNTSYYYPRFQQLIQEDDIVITETGTLFYGMSQVRLPHNAMYIGQGGWQSIGYATPSTFGASIAAPNRRVLLFTGEGSMQLTVQELSSMLEYGCKPIIFVLNNGGYTIEKYLNVKEEVAKQTYNEIPGWNYTQLISTFGRDAYTARVTTNGELDEAIRQAEQEQQHRLCLIELIAGDPMDAPDYMKKIREFMREQEKQQ